MLHVGNDTLDKIGSFNTQIKTDRNGGVFVYAISSGGAVVGQPYPLLFKGSCYSATDLSASYKARIGIPPAALTSGCAGWFQIRGLVTGAQGAATSFNGSFGHAVYWGGATGLGAADSAYQALLHQVGILVEDVGGGGSTTANIWLTGKRSQSL